MKNISKFFSFLAGMTLLAGCIDDSLFSQGDDNGQLQFLASMDDAPSLSVESRTVLGGDGVSVSFVDGDAIKIFQETKSGIYTTSSEQGGYRLFTGAGCDVDAPSYYAVYPDTAAVGYSTGRLELKVAYEQKAVNGSFDRGANVSVAKANYIADNKYHLKFHNVCCLLRFEVTAANDVDAIIVKGNDNEYLAGTVHVNPQNGKWADIVNGVKQVKLLPPTGNAKFPTGVYYMAILPQTFAKGISVKIEHNIGSYHYRKGNVMQLSMNRNNIFTVFQGDLSRYTEVAMLPPLANQDGYVNKGHQTVYFKGVTRIELISNASEEDYTYAEANNMAEIMEGSNVRGYVGDSKGHAGAITMNGLRKEVAGSTLYLFTPLKEFSISDDNKAYSDDPASKLFNAYTNVTEIVGLNNLHATFVKNFSNMFNQCNALTSIDISGWDTSSAINMSLMFNTAAGSKLQDITLGEYFVTASKHGNMFGNTDRRTAGAGGTDNRITLHAPSNVESLASEFPNQIKSWEVYYAKGVFENVVLSDNRPYYIDESDYTSPLTVTFELGGLESAVSALTTVRLGLIRFEPVNTTECVYDTQVKYGGREYAVYDYTLSAAEKAAKKVTIAIKPVPHKSSEPMDGKGNIALSATNFETYTSPNITVASAPYSIDIETQGGGETATISDYTDLTGGNHLVQGQSAKVSVRVNTVAIEDDAFASLTINDWPCTEGESAGGYTTFTTTDAHEISASKASKSLTVTAHLTDGTTQDAPTKAKVDVWGITAGSAIGANAGNISTSATYLMKQGSDYLTGGSSLSTSTTVSVNGLWKFDVPSSGRAKIKMANDSKGIIQSGNNAPSLGDAGSATSYYVKTNTGFDFRIGNATGRYLGKAASSTGTVNWSLIPVTFNAPTAP